MLDGLQSEITRHPELSGASKKIIINTLNAPGSAEVEGWVVNLTPVMISQNDLYMIYLGRSSRIALRNFLAGDSDDQKDMKMIMDAVEDKGINLALEPVRELLTGLHAAGIGTADEYARLMRKGEVLKSRAEELFGRKVTLEDF